MLVQCLLVLIAILLLVDLWKPRKFVKLHERLGNDWRYYPIFGNAIQFMGSNEDRMATFSQIHLQAAKRKDKAISVWLANIFFIGIADADLACAVLKSALDKNFVYKLVKPLSGNGSIFAPVEVWHRRRKILTPTFAPRHVNRFVTVFETQSKVAAEQLESRVGKGNFSCYDYICPYALDSVCETLFGVNVNMQRQPDHPFFYAFTEILKNILARMSQPWLHIDALFKLLPMYTKQQHIIKIIHDFVDDLIHKKKSQMNKNVENIKENYNATHFRIQEVLGDSDKPIHLEDLSKLKYTKAVIKETLRLYPPAPFIARYLKKDLELPSGLVLPEGSNVVVSIWGIQRNPEHWGEDANDFNPDRFMSGQIPSPNAFIAFSYGARNCVGNHYAMLSMTISLLTMLRRYRFTPATNFKFDKNNPLRLSFDFLIKHIDNFPVQIEYRN